MFNKTTVSISNVSETDPAVHPKVTKAKEAEMVAGDRMYHFGTTDPEYAGMIVSFVETMTESPKRYRARIR